MDSFRRYIRKAALRDDAIAAAFEWLERQEASTEARLRQVLGVLKDFDRQS